MTRIWAVDLHRRVWSVEDLLTPSQTSHIQSLPWLSLPWRRESVQSHWPRRRIDPEHPDVALVSSWITDQLSVINAACDTHFAGAAGHFWLDEPGFVCPMHTDGHLPVALQMYWHAAGPDLGTGFYYDRGGRALQYQFESRPNTGYLLLNHLDPNGSQPLHWHAMTQPVPLGTYRLSSYWYLA